MGEMADYYVYDIESSWPKKPSGALIANNLRDLMTQSSGNLNNLIGKHFNIKVKPKMSNLNITSGSKTIWVSADGRRTPVSELELPHLFNILERLHMKYFEGAFQTIGEHKVYKTEIDADKYLTEHCPTYEALKARAVKVRLPGIPTMLKYGRPSRKVMEWVDKQREIARQTKARQKAVEQLEEFTPDMLDVLVERVAAKLKKRKR